MSDVEGIKLAVLRASGWAEQSIGVMSQAEEARQQIGSAVGAILEVLNTVSLTDLEQHRRDLIEDQTGAGLDMGRSAAEFASCIEGTDGNSLIIEAAEKTAMVRDLQAETIPHADAVSNSLESFGSAIGKLRTVAEQMTQRLELIGKANSLSQKAGDIAIRSATAYIDRIS